METRGVVWVTWGERQPADLWRSLASVRETNPGLRVCLITSAPIEHAAIPLFDVVRERTINPPDCRGRAAVLHADSPFDTCLHLDTDTVVCSDLSYGFAMAERYGVACTTAPASDGVAWHKLDGLHADMVQYQAGVLFYRNPCQALSAWAAHNRLLDGGRFSRQDQPGLMIALHEQLTPPYVLPRTWNYRPQFYRDGFGPIRVWHGPGKPPKLGRDTGFWQLKGAL